MNQSDTTFELVKSLTQNEKRYFRVFSGTSASDKNYLKVFDVLDKMKIYDSKFLNKKLAGAKINVPYEKNYLQKQILKSLRTFYSESSSSIELQDILKTIEILYRKRLTSHCQKLIDKGIDICKKYEQWNYHLEFIEWQYRVYGRTGNYEKLMVYEAEGLKEKKELLDSISTYAQIQNEIYAVITIAQNQSIYAVKTIQEEFENAIRRALALLKKQKGGFRIPELLYSTLYLAAHYTGNLKDAYKYSSENYRLYHNNSHFISDLSFKFFVAIGNLINRCIFLKKYNEGLKYISELKIFVKQLSSFASQEIQQEQHSALFGYETRILLDNHQYTEALTKTKAFEKTYNPKNLRKNIILTDGVKVARVYFVNGLLKESLKRLNVLINENTEAVKLDFFTYSHLMRLCIHYDLKNQDVLNHLTQTAQRFLEKHKVEDDFAYAFIEMINLIGKTDLLKKQKQIFSDFYPKLKKMLKDPFEHYPELVEWVEGKIK